MSAQDIIYTINGDSKNVDIFRVDDEKVYYNIWMKMSNIKF